MSVAKHSAHASIPGRFGRLRDRDAAWNRVTRSPRLHAAASRRMAGAGYSPKRRVRFVHGSGARIPDAAVLPDQRILHCDGVA